MNVRSAVLAATLILGSTLATVPVAMAQNADWPLPATAEATASVRFSPDQTAPQVDVLTAGELLLVLGPIHVTASGEYVPVKTADGNVGFVLVSFLDVEGLPGTTPAAAAVAPTATSPVTASADQPTEKRKGRRDGATRVAPSRVASALDGSGRATPLPMGTWADVGSGWSIVVTDVIPDATGIVMDENQFNDPPQPGHQFFMVTIRARYSGADSADYLAQNSLYLLGSGSVAYQPFGPGCGVIPNDFDDSAEVFPGGSLAGNLCFSVPSNEVGSFVLYAEDFWSFDDKRVWFAVS